jgi:hypothetical protein
VPTVDADLRRKTGGRNLAFHELTHLGRGFDRIHETAPPCQMERILAASTAQVQNAIAFQKETVRVSPDAFPERAAELREAELLVVGGCQRVESMRS